MAWKRVSGFGFPFELDWVAHTPVRNLSCFISVFDCDSFPIFSMTKLPGITAYGNALTCDYPLGTGYVTAVFYQYSRYKQGQVPAGAVEWEPAAIPATATTLEIPGKLIRQRHWRLKTGAGAFKVAGPNMIHPNVDGGSAPGTTATGGSATPILAAGTGKITVSTFDCGAVPNVAFSIDVHYVPGSAGHGHFVSGNTTPPFSRFGDIQTSYSGATGSATSTTPGTWTSPTITGGRFAGDFEITTTTADPRITDSASQRTATGNIAFGFAGLGRFELPEADLATYMLLTGDRNGSYCASQICDNHLLLNHYSTPELQDVAINVAVDYYTEAVDLGLPTGALGINDMSLPHGGRFDLYGQWTEPGSPGSAHGTHRIGVDVDIDSRLWVEIGGVPGRGPGVNQSLLNWVVENLHGSRMPEGSPNQIHYRLPASVIDAILRRF